MLWFYRRDEEQLTCEVRLAFDAAAYELHIRWPDGTRTIERYAELTQALRREESLEQTWRAQGCRELNEIATTAREPRTGETLRRTGHPGAVVLLVEDDPNSRAGYVECLSAQGFDVHSAGTGADAVASAEEQPPDIVVTDVHLPDFDGLELTRCLKSQHELSAAPVIGLTGHWDPEITKRAHAAGMIALLLKPVAPAHLLAEIEHALNETAARDS